jgi:hypothetical protein
MSISGLHTIPDTLLSTVVEKKLCLYGVNSGEGEKKEIINE